MGSVSALPIGCGCRDVSSYRLTAAFRAESCFAVFLGFEPLEQVEAALLTGLFAAGSGALLVCLVQGDPLSVGRQAT